MVAVQHPRADCGHVAALTQRCGKCLRWCCPECYLPWTALACSACRVQAQIQGAEADPVVASPAESTTGRLGESRCRLGGRARAQGTGSRRHRERGDVRILAERVAALERRLGELRPNP